MAAQDPGLELADSLEGGREEVKVHAEEDILHGEIGGDEGDLHGFDFIGGLRGVI